MSNFINSGAFSMLGLLIALLSPLFGIALAVAAFLAIRAALANQRRGVTAQEQTVELMREQNLLLQQIASKP